MTDRDHATAAVSPDAFKGTLTAPALAAAIGRGLEAGGLPPPTYARWPTAGRARSRCSCRRWAASPRPRPCPTARRSIEAGFALLEDGDTALLEVAEASGLDLVPEAERDAEAATSRGTGELIAGAVAAAAQRCSRRRRQRHHRRRLGSDRSDRRGGRPAGAALVVLCDMRTPFEARGAPLAPQKGADPAAVRRLDRRLAAQATRLPAIRGAAP